MAAGRRTTAGSLTFWLGLSIGFSIRTWTAFFSRLAAATPGRAFSIYLLTYHHLVSATSGGVAAIAASLLRATFTVDNVLTFWALSGLSSQQRQADVRIHHMAHGH